MQVNQKPLRARLTKSGSENYLSAELQDSWVLRRSNPSEVARSASGVRVIEVDVVEQIKELGPELERGPFCDSCVLQNREIGVKETRSTQNVSAGVSERAGRIHHEY